MIFDNEGESSIAQTGQQNLPITGEEQDSQIITAPSSQQPRSHQLHPQKEEEQEQSDIDLQSLLHQKQPTFQNTEEQMDQVWKQHLQFLAQIKNNTSSKKETHQRRKWRELRENSKIKIKGQIYWEQVKFIRSTVIHRGITSYVVELKNSRKVIVDSISLHHYLPQMVLHFYDRQTPILKRLVQGQK